MASAAFADGGTHILFILLLFPLLSFPFFCELMLTFFELMFAFKETMHLLRDTLL